MHVIFTVNGHVIRISRGDTGLLTLEASGNVVFTDEDRAVLTVRRRGGGAALLRQTAVPDAQGSVQFAFTHEMTERLRPDAYEWDVRYVLGAQEAEGRVSGGREVITPMEPAPFLVARTVGCL
ncbi:MAG: hypothetical protein J6K32_00310 [Clostridia bacterium]|nr:hypothetical protein [Clostridia bacterium]